MAKIHMAESNGKFMASTVCIRTHVIRTESLGHRLGCNVISADTSPPSLLFGGSDDDDSTRPTQQLVSTDVWGPQTH